MAETRQFLLVEAPRNVAAEIERSIEANWPEATVDRAEDATASAFDWREAERQLRESEERLELAFQGANDGLWDWKVDGTQVYYSPRWKSMLGYAEDEIGSDFSEWRDRLHPDDGDAAVERVRAYLASGPQEPFESEFRMRHKDGRYVTILSRAQPVYDADGKLTRLVGTHVDITDLREAQAELARQKERIEQYLQLAGTMFIALDTEGRVTLANAKACEVLGREMEELVGHDWFEIAIPETERDTVRSVFKGLMRGEIIEFGTFENTVLTRDGDERMVLWNNSTLYDADGKATGIVGSGMDMTDRRRAQAALEDANAVRAELEYIVERSPAVAFLWRNADGWPVEYVSRNISTFGYAPERLMAGDPPFAELVHPDDLERIGREVAEYTASGEDRFRQEYRLLTNDGAVRWVDDRTWIRRDETGTVTHYQGVLLDITKQKEYEASLKRANRALQTLSAANEVLVRSTDETSLTRDVCAQVAKRGGYPLVWVGFKETDADKSVRPVASAGALASFCDTQKFSWDEERDIGRGPTGVAIRSGREVVIRDIDTDPRYVPWRDKAAAVGLRSSIALPLILNGETIGNLTIGSTDPDAFDTEEVGLLKELGADLAFGIGALREREERARLEVHRLELERRLNRTQKMEALGTLAGGIAHDFNNMLLPILTLTEMTVNNLPEGSRDRERLEKVLEASRRARDLVGRIMGFSREEEPAMVMVRLEDVVERTTDLLRATVPTTIDIEKTITPLPTPILADPTQVQTVLMNLAANAVDALIGRTGKLTISLGPAVIDEARAMELLLREPGTYAKLTVADTGVGMPPEILDRIFDPFFTTKEVGSGTGFGLATAHSIIAQHNGSITARSTVNKGSTFDIYLPLADAGPPA